MGGRTSRQFKWIAWAAVLTLLAGCEAKLRLQDVEAAKHEPIRRSDQFQAAVASDPLLVVVGLHGIVVTSADHGATWTRHELAGWPSLIGLTRCPNGSLVALAYEGELWTAPATAETWVRQKIETKETPQAITCDPTGQLWVVGSYSSILNSADGGKTWKSQSLDDDLFLTSVQFVDAKNAIATGEFGTIVKSTDAGATWQKQDPMPEEFYPEDTWFKDALTGWSVSLRGRLLGTTDGGATWTMQETPTVAPLFKLGAAGAVPLAVGGDGVVLRRVDDAWQAVTYEDPYNLYLRVLLPVGDKLLIAGGSGALRVIPLANTNKAVADAGPAMLTR